MHCDVYLGFTLYCSYLTHWPTRKLCQTITFTKHIKNKQLASCTKVSIKRVWCLVTSRLVNEFYLINYSNIDLLLVRVCHILKSK